MNNPAFFVQTKKGDFARISQGGGKPAHYYAVTPDGKMWTPIQWTRLPITAKTAFSKRYASGCLGAS